MIFVKKRTALNEKKTKKSMTQHIELSIVWHCVCSITFTCAQALCGVNPSICPEPGYRFPCNINNNTTVID